MGELNFCTAADIFKIAYENAISQLSKDVAFPFLVSRFFHNKIFSFIHNILRCYILYFDTKQLGRWVPLIFLPFIFFALIAKGGRKWIWSIQIMMPIFFIFNPLHLELGAKLIWFKMYYETVGTLGIVKCGIFFLIN